MATAPIVDKQASRSAPSGLSLGDDEQEHRSRRLLLDGSSSVRRLARTRRWLLSWTTTSSRDSGPGIIATRECATSRRIARAIAIASNEQRGRYAEPCRSAASPPR